MSSRAPARAAALAVAAIAVILAWAAPAAAHITVNPGEAVRGGYTKVAFRVPNESDTASTTRVEIVLPTDTPIASVSLSRAPGWSAATEKAPLSTPVSTADGELTEAISKITWTAAADAAIAPGEFAEFDVLLGPLPEADQVVFKALQTYSDGTVVRWIEEPSGGAEPANPAPVLKLTAASAEAATRAETAAEAPAEAEGSAGNAYGIAGIALGLAGLVAGLLAYRRTSSVR